MCHTERPNWILLVRHLVENELTTVLLAHCQRLSTIQFHVATTEIYGEQKKIHFLKYMYIYLCFLWNENEDQIFYKI